MKRIALFILLLCVPAYALSPAFYIYPRFPTGPDTVIDVPLNGPMSATQVQNHSQTDGHLTFFGSSNPVFQYPGLLCDKDAESTAMLTLTTTISYPITIMGWVKVAASDSGNEDFAFLGRIDGQTPYFKLKFQTGATSLPRTRYNNTGTNMLAANSGSYDYTDGLYHHVAGVLPDLANLDLYLDGVLDTEGGAEAAIPPAPVVADEFNLLTHYVVAGNTFDAGDPGNPKIIKNTTVGDMIVELRAMTAAEVKNHFELTKHKYGR